MHWKGKYAQIQYFRLNLPPAPPGSSKHHWSSVWPSLPSAHPGHNPSHGACLCNGIQEHYSARSVRKEHKERHNLHTRVEHNFNQVQLACPYKAVACCVIAITCTSIASFPGFTLVLTLKPGNEASTSTGVEKKNLRRWSLLHNMMPQGVLCLVIQVQFTLLRWCST